MGERESGCGCADVIGERPKEAERGQVRQGEMSVGDQKNLAATAGEVVAVMLRGGLDRC